MGITVGAGVGTKGGVGGDKRARESTEQCEHRSQCNPNPFVEQVEREQDQADDKELHVIGQVPAGVYEEAEVEAEAEVEVELDA
jgi:hypothetical protein